MFRLKDKLEEGEVIVYKKLASASWDGLNYVNKIDGNLIVTNKRILFTSYFNIDVIIEFRVTDIDYVTKEKYMLVFPQVSVVLRSGQKFSFPLMAGGDTLKNIIEARRVQRFCKQCGKPQQTEWDVCPHCGTGTASVPPSGYAAIV